MATHTQQVTRRNSNLLWFFFLLAIVLVGGSLQLFGGMGYSAEVNELNNEDIYTEKHMKASEVEFSDPSKFLTVESNHTKIENGRAFKMNSLIKNTAKYTSYKNPILEVTYYSKTNSILTAERYTVFEDFNPGDEKNFEFTINNYEGVEALNWNIVEASIN